MDSFLDELRRRNVIRLAATYALAGWILIEAGSVILPTFGVPDWFFRAYVLVIFAGFVASLVVAWVFEITPDGVKLDRDVDRSQPRRQSRSKSNSIIIALLLVALGVSITFNVSGIRDQAPSGAAEAGDISLAVLPFTSRSTDPENVFFADGIHDDLLTRLAEIDSLRVISRTSVNEYRNTSKNLRQIGEELGVTTVVEGAVQRSGDQVRITVQLIDATSDEHLWAETFDRGLTIDNVFDIQTTVSTEIASALRAVLTPAEAMRLAAKPTHSLEALASYTAARDNLQKRQFLTLQEARRQFERAIAADPDYAQAYAGLAETILVTLSNHQSIDSQEAYELAGQALDRALQIDDQLSEAYAVKGLLEYSQWISTRVGDGAQKAAAAFERAIKLNPNLSDAYVWFSSLRELQGDLESAIDLLTKAMHVDPLGRIAYVNLPGLYATRGESEKAIALLLKAVDIFPDWATPPANLGSQLLALGRLDEGVAWINRARSMTEDPLIGSMVLGPYAEFGDLEKLRAFGEQFPPDHPLYRAGSAYLRFIDNDFEGAVELLIAEEGMSANMSQFAYPVLYMSAIKLGDYARAAELIRRSNPLLASDTNASVDRKNLRAAILLAFVSKQLDEPKRTDALLTRAEEVVRRLPRMGMSGHGISDVHIFILRGRTDAALDALRDAVDAGFVSLTTHDHWTLDQNPMIDALRGHPRYEAMRLEIEQKIATMRDNVERAEESGDWNELLGRVRTPLSASLRGRTTKTPAVTGT